jgi:hypothetical protein
MAVVGVAMGFLHDARPVWADVQATLHVSPSGTGSTCSEASPCALTAVPAAVRALNVSQTGDIIVYLRGGTYRMTSTLALGPADSGKNGFTVSYQAFPGEQPVLTGAVPVTGFVLHDASAGIWSASVPAGSVGRQLFVNGLRAERARTLNNAHTFTRSGSTFTTSSALYRTFTNQTHVEIVQEKNWKHMRCPLASITASGSGSKLNVQAACFASNNTSVNNPGFPFNGNGLPLLDNITYVENAYQLLTQPGQFYLDRVASKLYYKPRPGESMATATVELPRLETPLVSLNGTPGHLAPVNNNDSRAVYTGSWTTSSARKLGDFKDDVRHTTGNGNSVTFTFTGTGLDVLAETNTDQGSFNAFVDNVQDTGGPFTQNGPTRLAQQVVYSVSGLTPGSHSVRLVKTGGTYFLIDAFVVVPEVLAPVQNLSFSGITFSGHTWTVPSSSGYIDNQAGILWDPVTKNPTRPRAAFEVHRGLNIAVFANAFKGLGANALDFADGTQSSTAHHNLVDDVSGTGILLGEVDDYFLKSSARMTLGNTIAHNWISFVGQDYHDAVGIWVGHSRNTLIDHNDVGHTPYTGISVGWGWGYASNCTLQTAPRWTGQGLASCRRGTIYSGNNQILGNHVHHVMNITSDGGNIYTLGGENGNGPATSTFAGNFLEGGPNNNNMLYHDEGGSYWNTYDNVTSGAVGRWVGMWTPTIHDLTIHDNFTDNATFLNRGNNVTITNTTVVTGGNWPPAALTIMNSAGPDAPP